jgi:tRNA-dihydrouridine synthase
VDGILHPTGFERLKIDLEYTENQRPIVAQIWGTDPEKFYEASKLMVNLGFDGIDINMGCPQDKEIGIGACAALIRNPVLASEIIEATIKGAGSLPVSVKTRTGYSKPETEI